MAVLLLHNVCIHRNDSYKPRWRLSVSDTELIDAESDWTQTEIVKTKAWKEPTKTLTGCENKKFDYTVYIYNC